MTKGLYFQLSAKESGGSYISSSSVVVRKIIKVWKILVYVFSRIHPKMFSTDFIFRQQENLIDNQKCQTGFRPLGNKILSKYFDIYVGESSNL